MKKLCAFVVVLLLLGVAARRFGSQVDWEKKLEAMPDNAPPKWMFRNITAIRENTDQILKLLKADRPEAPAPDLLAS